MLVNVTLCSCVSTRRRGILCSTVAEVTGSCQPIGYFHCQTRNKKRFFYLFTNDQVDNKQDVTITLC